MMLLRAARSASVRRVGSTSVRRMHLHVEQLSPPATARREALVFVHGLLGNGVNFRSIALAKPFTSHYDVLTVDLRNHGRSPHSDEPMTLETMADDLVETMNARGHTEFTIVGHSLGGKVGSVAALLHPDAVTALVAMDIGACAYDVAASRSWADVQNVVKSAAALDIGSFSARAAIDRALAPAIPDAGMRGFLLQNIVPVPHHHPGHAHGQAPGHGPAYKWRVNLPALLDAMPRFAAFPAYPPRAGGFLCAFIRGELSDFLGPQQWEATRASFPEASLHTLPGARHWLHADKPAEFVAMLDGILTAFREGRRLA